jgi:hypothetical protein
LELLAPSNINLKQRARYHADHSQGPIQHPA